MPATDDEDEDEDDDMDAETKGGAIGVRRGRLMRKDWCLAATTLSR
jgi:hypothetical protein